MGLKTLFTNIQSLSKEKSLRCDVDFVEFQNHFTLSKYYSFKDLFEIVKDNKVNLENLDDDFYYVEIGNVTKNGVVEPVKLNFNNREIEDENYYKKIEKGDIIQVQVGDILISKVRPNLKKFVFIDEDNKNYYYTSAFIHLRPKKLNKILYYSLRSIFYNNLIAISRQGKGYPTIKEDDMLCLKFDKNIIDTLINKKADIDKDINFIEEEIKQLQNKIENPQKIINKIFAKEFNFNESLYDDFGKGMTAGTQTAKNRTLRTFETNFSDIATNKILRSSTRYHNIPTKTLTNILKKIDTIKVKDVVESYEKGIQPDYVLYGDIPVIKIANLKNGYIDFSETEYISKEDYDKLSERKKIKHGDIILCVTGKVSLGKIDYYDYENEAITTVDNYVLRLKDNYNPLFFIYFFRCILGCFQVERDYTGTTNQIHLYWDEISNFKIPNLKLTLQQKIVDEIKSELDLQEQIKNQIEENYVKIENLLTNIIKSPEDE